MNSNQEKFSINWEDLKYLIECAEGYVKNDASYATSSEQKKQLFVKIEELKEKYDYNSRIQRDREEHQKKQREEKERENKMNLNPLRRKFSNYLKNTPVYW